jgi:transcriptional regulator with XRE-family HTH domain
MKTPSDESLSRQLRNLRIKARLTQEELAYQAGVSRKTISTMETGDGCDGVSLSVLNRVMGALGVEILLVPKAPPTLDDLLNKNRKLFNGEEARTLPERVRKTAGERLDDEPGVSCAP